ncbi:MAG TPA: hypothetical protein VJ385_00485 [Fibrobacteria bacterium]|nr:hypothetical protein [Fibrobacteria bacterium]
MSTECRDLSPPSRSGHLKHGWGANAHGVGKTIRPAPASEPYDIGQDERLRKSPKFALDYLNICLDDPDPGLFLVALRDVARAHGGMKHLAQKANLNRDALYHTLSKRGNPTLSSLEALLDVLGFKPKIERK